MPSSAKRASACAFRSASIRILIFVVVPAIQSSPFLLPFLLVDIVYSNCTKKTILCTNIYCFLHLSKGKEHIGYSPRYCSEQFHRLAGMTIREYVFRRCLAMAIVDLWDTDISIIDIASQYGFSDQSTFTRAFKKYAYGCAPSEYRKRPRPLPLACKKMRR